MGKSLISWRHPIKSRPLYICLLRLIIINGVHIASKIDSTDRWDTLHNQLFQLPEFAEYNKVTTRSLQTQYKIIMESRCKFHGWDEHIDIETDGNILGKELDEIDTLVYAVLKEILKRKGKLPFINNKKSETDTLSMEDMNEMSNASSSTSIQTNTRDTSLLLSNNDNDNNNTLTTSPMTFSMNSGGMTSSSISGNINKRIKLRGGYMENSRHHFISGGHYYNGNTVPSSSSYYPNMSHHLLSSNTTTMNTTTNLLNSTNNNNNSSSNSNGSRYDTIDINTCNELNQAISTNSEDLNKSTCTSLQQLQQLQQLHSQHSSDINSDSNDLPPLFTNDSTKYDINHLNTTNTINTAHSSTPTTPTAHAHTHTHITNNKSMNNHHIEISMEVKMNTYFENMSIAELMQNAGLSDQEEKNYAEIESVGIPVLICIYCTRGEQFSAKYVINAYKDIFSQHLVSYKLFHYFQSIKDQLNVDNMVQS